jgi:hypothetical protein
VVRGAVGIWTCTPSTVFLHANPVLAEALVVLVSFIMECKSVLGRESALERISCSKRAHGEHAAAAAERGAGGTTVELLALPSLFVNALMFLSPVGHNYRLIDYSPLYSDGFLALV